MFFFFIFIFLTGYWLCGCFFGGRTLADFYLWCTNTNILWWYYTMVLFLFFHSQTHCIFCFCCFFLWLFFFFRLVICLFRWPDFGLHMMCGTWFESFAIPYHLHLRYLAYRMALIFTVSKNSSSLFLLREDKWTMGKFTTFIQTGKTHLKPHTYSQRGRHQVLLSGHTNLPQWRTVADWWALSILPFEILHLHITRIEIFSRTHTWAQSGLRDVHLSLRLKKGGIGLLWVAKWP